MAIIDTHVLGIAGKCYVGAAGSTPTVLLNDEQEVSLKVTNTIAKRATRGSPRKSGRPSTQEISADLTIAKDPANASYILLRAAAIAAPGTAIAVKFLDAVSGTGYDGDWYVESWEESQPLDDWDGTKVTLAYTADYRTLTVI
jgi:hypothetical protein